MVVQQSSLLSDVRDIMRQRLEVRSFIRFLTSKRSLGDYLRELKLYLISISKSNGLETPLTVGFFLTITEPEDFLLGAFPYKNQEETQRWCALNMLWQSILVNERLIAEFGEKAFKPKEAPKVDDLPFS